MCTPSAPSVTQTATPPPAATPQPLALADKSSSGNVTQLRIGSKQNLKMQSSGLSIPSQGSAA